MKTKIVTAYWMDCEGYPFQGGYPIRKIRYLGSLIGHCQGSNLPVICYTHEKSLKELTDIKNEYNLETHKKLIIENLLDKKYDMEIINEWLDYL
jgi:hypothetical protein